MNVLEREEKKGGGGRSERYYEVHFNSPALALNISEPHQGPS